MTSEVWVYLLGACFLLASGLTFLLEGLANRHRRRQRGVYASLDEQQQREWRAGWDAPSTHGKQFGHYVGKYGKGRQ